MVNIKNLAKLSLQVISRERFIYRYPQKTECVYLTFDDGPHPEFTPQVLEILKRYKQQATFFLIGKNVEAFPSMVAETKAHGHRLGLHTFTHQTLDLMERTQFMEEVRQNQASIFKAIAEEPMILRPPKGRVRFKNISWAKALGIKLIHYTITSNDWKAKSHQDILDAVGIGQVRGGDIISFHDTNVHTVDALPLIMEQLSRRKLSCATIPSGERLR